MMKLGSLFSGIGGLELGLERAGVGRVVWQVEQDEYCRQVLSKHWPDVRRFEDVRTVGAQQLAAVDVICGGFPCQDLSIAGSGEGLDGSRSGLWFEFARIIRELLPRFVIVENVPALTIRGLDRVLGTLAELGYSARWGLLSAQDVGSPHLRRRLFIIAWRDLANTDGPRSEGRAKRGERDQKGRAMLGAGDQDVANANLERLRFVGIAEPAGLESARWRVAIGRDEQRIVNRAARPGEQAAPKPGLGRVANGVPAGLDYRWPAGRGPEQYDHEPQRTRERRSGDRKRLKALGNAVVPQCAYVIGRELLQMEIDQWTQ